MAQLRHARECLRKCWRGLDRLQWQEIAADLTCRRLVDSSKVDWARRLRGGRAKCERETVWWVSLLHSSVRSAAAQAILRPPYNYTTTPVGSLFTCQSSVSGYAGVFDLSGNVAEWEDSCLAHSSTSTPGYSDYCNMSGGSFSSDWGGLRSMTDSTSPRYYTDVKIGFRCCSDP